jgi:uncharacterized protein YprB with RNaseH-like and TPR domain
MHKPKILFFDIETAPIIAAVWSLYSEGVVWTEKDWHLLSWAAKWAGEPRSKIRYRDQSRSKDISNDKAILKELRSLLDEADIVVGHNVDKFDRRKVNARLVLHGIDPPSSYKTLDTLKIARKHFAFTSNRLEYLADKLGASKKGKHSKYPGAELWKATLRGEPKAWKEMEKYNKLDVIVLEEVYKKLMPWDDALDFGVYSGQVEVMRCSCGSKKFKKNGNAYYSTGMFPRFACSSCGRELKAGKARIRAALKKGLLPK